MSCNSPRDQKCVRFGPHPGVGAHLGHPVGSLQPHPVVELTAGTQGIIGMNSMVGAGLELEHHPGGQGQHPHGGLMPGPQELSVSAAPVLSFQPWGRQHPTGLDFGEIQRCRQRTAANCRTSIEFNYPYIVNTIYV